MKCEILTCFIKCDIDAMIKNLLNLQISVCIFFSSIKFFFFLMVREIFNFSVTEHPF